MCPNSSKIVPMHAKSNHTARPIQFFGQDVKIAKNSPSGWPLFASADSSPILRAAFLYYHFENGYTHRYVIYYLLNLTWEK